MILPTLWQALQTPNGWTATKTVDQEMFFQHRLGQVLSLKYQEHFAWLRAPYEVIVGGSDFFNVGDRFKPVQHYAPQFHSTVDAKLLLRWSPLTKKTSAQDFGVMMYENLGLKMVDRARALAHVLAKSFGISDGYWAANASHLIFDDQGNNHEIWLSYGLDLYDFFVRHEWYLLSSSGCFEKISNFKILAYPSRHLALERQEDIEWVLERLPMLQDMYQR